MNSYRFGRLVYSKSGHDKGNVYVIFDSDDEYVYLIDGKLKPISKPKKKNKKHINLINRFAFELIEKSQCDRLTDEEVKRAIKLFLKESK